MLAHIPAFLISLYISIGLGSWLRCFLYDSRIYPHAGDVWVMYLLMWRKLFETRLNPWLIWLLLFPKKRVQTWYDLWVICTYVFWSFVSFFYLKFPYGHLTSIPGLQCYATACTLADLQLFSNSDPSCLCGILHPSGCTWTFGVFKDYLLIFFNQQNGHWYLHITVQLPVRTLDVSERHLVAHNDTRTTCLFW